MKAVLSIFAIGILMQFCGNTESFSVQYAGALKDMMHKGDISAKAALNDLKNQPALYALGAVENLKGEIIILDGKPFVSYVHDDSLHIDNSFNRNAVLLVYAQVKKWQEVAIPGNIGNHNETESFILEAAKKRGINVDAPFPFMIKGKISRAEWHVIDWQEGDTEHTPEKHKASGLRGEIENREVRLLGFYSDKHHAIFTHHSTNMHLHILTDDERISGHLDDFQLGENILLLPDTK